MQKFKNRFSMLSSQEIGWSLVLFQMIFEPLQFALFRLKFQSLSSEILKIPEFNLSMTSSKARRKLGQRTGTD